MRFASNVDGADVADAIEGLDPKRTLLIVVSKTFTTQETLANAEFVRAWGPKRIAAATAAPDKAVAWGVAADDVFPFWDWVGGRYSLWSSVSLVCEIALAHGAFFKMLEGAEAMDEHFRDAPFAQNLPALSGRHPDVEPRSARPRLLRRSSPTPNACACCPPGCSSSRWNPTASASRATARRSNRSACAVTWGAAGTNAQHSLLPIAAPGRR